MSQRHNRQGLSARQTKHCEMKLQELCWLNLQRPDALLDDHEIQFQTDTELYCTGIST